MAGVAISVPVHDIDLGGTPARSAQLFELLGILRPCLTRGMSAIALHFGKDLR